MGIDCPREDVTSIFFLGYSASRERYFIEGTEYPASPEDFAFMVDFMALVEPLLEEGKIIPHPASVRFGGLEGIISGMKELKQGKVSGQKLVYIIEEET